MQRKTTARSALALAFVLSASLGLAGGRPAGEAAPEAAPQPAAETDRRVLPGDARTASPGEDNSELAADTAPGEAGLRVRLDPQTGEILERGADPADEVPAARLDGPRGWLNTYGDDLIQEPLPEGGFRVDLRGRFQSSVVATIDPDTDEVVIDCVATADRAEAADDR